MGLFGKKRKTESESNIFDVVAQVPKECNHVYMDFPWYLESSFSTVRDNPTGLLKQKSVVNIYEPYVCILCKKRVDEKLYFDAISGSLELEDHEKHVRQFKDLYKDRLKPKAIIEDLINDAIYVDRDKLKIMNKIRNGGDLSIMGKYRKKDSAVEAWQTTSETTIETKDGKKKANPRDWILIDHAGNKSIVSPEDFEKLYEPDI